MSELSAFVKLVDQQYDQLIELQCLVREICRRYGQSEDLSVVSPFLPPVLTLEDSLSIQKARNQIESLTHTLSMNTNPLGEKLQTKMRQVDAVTGQARYGPASLSKLQAACQKLSDMLELGKVIHSAVERASEHLHPSASAPTPPPPPAAAAAAPIPAPTCTQIVHEDPDAQPVLPASREPGSGGEHLHREAQELRERQKHVAQGVSSALEAAALRLNASLCYRAEAVRFYAQLLAEDCRAAGRSPREPLGFAAALLERVLGRPEDAQARRLRFSHPVVWAKLTSLRGGLQLLVSLGFAAVVSPAEDTPAAGDGELRSAEGGLLLAHLPSVQAALLSLQALSAAQRGAQAWDAADYGPVLAQLLAPSTLLALALVMDEPPLEGAGTDGRGWLDWFDGLKRHRELLEEVLASS